MLTVPQAFKAAERAISGLCRLLPFLYEFDRTPWCALLEAFTQSPPVGALLATGEGAAKARGALLTLLARMWAAARQEDPDAAEKAVENAELVAAAAATVTAADGGEAAAGGRGWGNKAYSAANSLSTLEDALGASIPGFASCFSGIGGTGAGGGSGGGGGGSGGGDASVGPALQFLADWADGGSPAAVAAMHPRLARALRPKTPLPSTATFAAFSAAAVSAGPVRRRSLRMAKTVYRRAHPLLAAVDPPPTTAWDAVGAHPPLSDFADLVHVCWGCGKTSLAPLAPSSSRLRCARCQIAEYCSQKCSFHHWRESHAGVCRSYRWLAAAAIPPRQANSTPLPDRGIFSAASADSADSADSVDFTDFGSLRRGLLPLSAAGCSAFSRFADANFLIGRGGGFRCLF